MDLLNQAIDDCLALFARSKNLGPALQQLCDAMAACWDGGGKLLIAGNGGSAADSMHFAEELVARFQKNRRALAAIALCDPTVVTCAANDFGFDSIFARQVEALGKPGDLLIVMTTSGNSPNLVAAVAIAQKQGLTTAALLGKGGGKLKGICDVELIVDAGTSHRVQEVHKLLYHTACEWADEYAG